MVLNISLKMNIKYYVNYNLYFTETSDLSDNIE